MSFPYSQIVERETESVCTRAKESDASMAKTGSLRWNDPQPTTTYVVSLVIAALMTIASVMGLVFQAVVYPTPELRQAFVPSDVINLCMGLPALLCSVWLAWRGKLIGLLFWPGALYYVFYTYLVYVFGMPLNAGFLLHLALVTSSGYTMISLVASIDKSTVRRQLTGAVPERMAGAVLAGLGILFVARVIVLMIQALANQTLVGKPELALYVSDVVTAPALVIGGVLLWRREPLGYVAGLGLLFQASMLFLGLIVVLILQPFITTAQFVLGDVLAVSVMGMVCFVPFALFVRGAASRRDAPQQSNGRDWTRSTAEDTLPVSDS